MRIEFFVYGIPKPAGSKRGLVNPKTGKAILVDAAGKAGKDWRHDCKMAAVEVMQGHNRFSGPVKLFVQFCMPRPKSHYTTGKSQHLKETAPQWHTNTPDTTKLMRGLEDSLKGIVWEDDSQVAIQTAIKAYDDNNGALVIVEDLT